MRLLLYESLCEGYRYCELPFYKGLRNKIARLVFTLVLITKILRFYSFNSSDAK